jgi:hypothetical protein
MTIDVQIEVADRGVTFDRYAREDPQKRHPDLLFDVAL